MGTDRILITGGVGFIGTEVARHLLSEGRRVRLMDNLSSQIHGAIPDLTASTLLRDPRVEVARGDICSARDWEAALTGVSCVVHLAAETGTAQSMYEISRYTETNVGGTALLLNYLANHSHRVVKIVLASSRSVYGEGSYLCSICGVVYPPMRTEAMFRARHWQPDCPNCGAPIGAVATPETALTSPASIYAATKLAQEDLVRIAAKALGIPAVTFRFQNVYGEGQSLKNPYTGILSIFSNQLRGGKVINLYEDGHETRDFVHVSDVARAVALSIGTERADGKTLNVGSGRPTTVEQIARLLQERFQSDKEPVVSGQYRVGDIRHGYADMSAINHALDFYPEVTLEEGLDRFVTWVKQQPIEPDRLDIATRELVARGLMMEHADTQAAVV